MILATVFFFLLAQTIPYTILSYNQTIQKTPEDLAKIKGPKIVYAGNLGHRLDYDLLHQAAVQKPEYQFVFVGPINEREFKGKKLKKLPNVHFLGAKPLHEIPAYLQGASVCMIPFLCNDLTKFIYPLKINEYLAAGKPVVSSNFARLKEFDKVVYSYNNVQNFLYMLEYALNYDDDSKQEERQQLAARNTWQNRGKEMTELLNHYCQLQRLAAA